MIESIFQKELILIKQMHQKSVIFAIIWYFLDKSFNYEPYLCIGCHDLMQRAMNFMILLLSLLKGMITEFFFGILAKMMQ